MRLRLLFLLAPFFLGPALLCSQEPPLHVVTSFTIPADWANAIGGTHVQVSSLLPVNADLHAYHPTPSDIAKLNKSSTIIGISPTLEHWLPALLSAPSLQGKTLYLGQNLLPKNAAPFCESSTHSHAPDPAHMTEAARAISDPHLWMDPLQVIPMTQLLAEKFAAADPAHAAVYRANAAAYQKELKALDQWARQTLSAIPPERRILISNHDNLRRLAARYNLTIPDTLLSGSSPETADASAGKISALIQRAKQSKTPIFYDNTLNNKLALTVSQEAGLPPPVLLYTDALTAPPHPASTYLGLYRENIRRIAAALQ